MRPRSFAAFLLLLCVAAVPLAAQSQLTLSSANVIGGSPVFFNSPYNTGAYAAGNIFNQPSGAVDMTVQSGFAWFPYENIGTTNRYLTIDLGARYVLSSIDIFNSNQADRGTGHFSLSASNTFTTGAPDGGIGTGAAISAPTMLINATALTFIADTNPVAAQSFTISDGNAYRYLQLTAIDLPSSGGPFANSGLAEVRLYGTAAVPEPSTCAAILGAGALGLTAWRRRRSG
jgi:hypothetical protein